MALARRLALNVGGVLVGRGLGLAINAVTLLLIARSLGPERFGIYSLAFVYVSFFSTVIDNGVNITVTRALVREPTATPALLGNALLLKTAASVVLAAVAIAVVQLPAFAPELRTVVPVAAGLILVTGLSVVNAVFQVRLDMSWVVAGELVSRTLFLALAIAVIGGGHGVVWLFSAQVAAAGAGVLLPLWGALRLVRPDFTLRPAIWRDILSPATALSLSLVLGMLTARFDVIALSSAVTERDLGLYAAAFRVIDLLLLVPGLMLQVVFPTLVAGEAGHARLAARYRRVESVLVMIGLPAAAFLWVAATPTLVLTAGPAYADGGPSLALLALGMLAVYVSNGMLYVLVATGRSRALLAWSAAGAAVSVGLSLALVPTSGALGAGIATVTGHTGVMLGLGWTLWRHVGINPWPSLAGEALVVALVVGVTAAWLLPQVPFLAVVAAGGVAAAAVMFALPGSRRELRSFAAPGGALRL